MSTPRAIIFDVDGVLVDDGFAGPHLRATQELLREYGIDDHELDPDFLGRSARDIMGILRERYDLPDDVATLEQKKHDIFFRLLQDRSPVLLGARETVLAAKEIVGRIAMATSGTDRYVAKIKGMLQLEGAFDVTVTSDHVTHAKPAPDIYQETLRQLKLTPGDCLVVEDSVNGFYAARAAGISTVIILPPTRTAAEYEGARAIVGNIREVVPYFRGT